MVGLDFKEIILKLINEYEYKPLIFKELAAFLEVDESELALFSNTLAELESQGALVKTIKGKYVRPEMANMMVGIIQMNEKGFGFVRPLDEKDDIFIPGEYINGAMNQDKVLVKIRKKSSEGKRSEGEVTKILSRANARLIGTFERSRYYGFVTPDDKRVTGDIFVPKAEFNSAVTGCKVVVEIVKWPEKRRNAEGKIVEILGACGDPGIEITSIARSYGIEKDFPDDVIEQVKSIPMEVQEPELKMRRDLRDLRIVTIDGEDAKDLDDAVSIKKLPNGNYLLGVHIADVGYYVTEDSPLDREASRRGTSVYLVDRVIPMLPKELSNGICSLNAGVNRLAFSVMMEIDTQGNVVSHEIFKSIICVNERMTYTDVTRILVENNKDLISRFKNHLEDFKLMLELSEILSQKRRKRGSIDFDFPEVKIILDEFGKPVQVKRYEITVANKIIEEFMLVCNETVAERMFWVNAPFIYRIHEKPDQEKIEAFNEFLHALGYNIKGINKLHPSSLQSIIEQIKGKKEEKAVSTLMLRSLQQARYSSRNEGHFGLAAQYYCHFTSPIRRYPDLFIHRVINEMLDTANAYGGGRLKKLSGMAEEFARVSTEKEKAAEQAEREVEDLKKVEYMQDRLGEVYSATVSSVTSFGLFVEVEDTIEGLIHVDTLDDDYYIFDSKHYCLMGERTKRKFEIGDQLIVKLVRADTSSRRLDFIIQHEVREAAKNRKVKRRRS